MLIGHKVLHYSTVSSTNDIAWQHAGNQHGLVVKADEQTAGRGRRGDLWLAPPGSALLMSILLKPPPILLRPSVLTLWAAIGVCLTLERLLPLRPYLKWPNDVLINGKK